MTDPHDYENDILGGPVTAPPEEPQDALNDPHVVDTTPPEVRPEDFDFDAFLSGARRTRRGVRIFNQGRVIGEMEHLADTISRLPDGDPKIDGLIDEFEALKASFGDGVWWEVEARSEEWIMDFWRKGAARQGFLVTDEGRVVSKNGKATDRAAEVSRALTMAQVAAQTVAPERVSVAQLRILADDSPAEYAKILTAIKYANSQSPASAQVLRLDFSQRRSTQRGTD